MYTRIPYWVQNYGDTGMHDQQAVQVFMDCETTELVNSLRNELIGVAQGNYTEEVIERIVGLKRKIKFGSYDEWAKLMLLWLASYKA